MSAGAAYPPLMTADEVAELLRTTRRAIYGLAERALIPGAVHVGRRLLFRRDELLPWLGLAKEDG